MPTPALVFDPLSSFPALAYLLQHDQQFLAQPLLVSLAQPWSLMPCALDSTAAFVDI
ncbi:hypothetical protein C0993_004214, partial [Termitomyces sp. T159_Od127]